MQVYSLSLDPRPLWHLLVSVKTYCMFEDPTHLSHVR